MCMLIGILTNTYIFNNNPYKKTPRVLTMILIYIYLMGGKYI